MIAELRSISKNKTIARRHAHTPMRARARAHTCMHAHMHARACLYTCHMARVACRTSHVSDGRGCSSIPENPPQSPRGIEHSIEHSIKRSIEHSIEGLDETQPRAIRRRRALKLKKTRSVGSLMQRSPNGEIRPVVGKKNMFHASYVKQECSMYHIYNKYAPWIIYIQQVCSMHHMKNKTTMFHVSYVKQECSMYHI